MSTFIQEAKRFQKLAGILKEEQNDIPEDIKQYLLSMVSSFSDGNDNEYPAGKKMKFSYEGNGEHDNVDVYGKEEVDKFLKTITFLKNNGPISINDKINYTYSTDGNNITMEWVEPNWNNY